MMRRRISPHSTRLRRSAHTLWELLLVLALVGAIGALVAPALPSLAPPTAENEVARTTNDLVTLFARTRLAALQRSASITLVIDPTSARVWSITASTDSLHIEPLAPIARAASVELVADGPRTQFVFAADGSAFGGPLLVRDLNDPRGPRLVSVDPWTGGTHVASP